MLRRLTMLIIWMMAVVANTEAQYREHSVPDYHEIEKLTLDKSSAFFYEGLYKRYVANDTTLTLRDYRMLYYGYFFQPGYTPFANTAESDSIKMLLGTKEDLAEGDWSEIIRLGTTNVNKNPFDLKGLNIVWVAYRQTGDSIMALVYFDKLKKIVQTILSTGDGLSEETAFHVVNVSHEYDILNILGYEFGGNQKLTEGKRDFLSLKSNPDNIEGLYFDVNQIFKGYEQHLSSKAP